jgi:[ribosomal protein S18]-alanine N-acetyltransferase
MTLPADVIMRRATMRDATILATLHAMVLPAGWSAQSFEELLCEPLVHGLLAVHTPSGHATGLCLLRRVRDEAELLTIGVLHDQQRRGIARALLATCVMEAREHGVTRVHLEVQEDNAEAIAFYTAMRFTPSGRRKDYYTTRVGRKDAILMRLLLA